MQLDLVHELPDGRRLGYCCFGAEDGYPVVALHGTPGSRYKFGIAAEEATRLGLRLICPDRWGYGLSDAPRASASLPGYAQDVESLLWELGVSRFGVVGVSGGGPYAVALGAVLSQRVSGLALVAPVAPLDLAERRRGISLFHRVAFRVLPRVPGTIPLAFSYFRSVLAVSPWLAIRSMGARAGRADRALLAEPDISADLVKTFRAGLARGVLGPAIDMRLFGRGWKLDLSAIDMPSRMWLGVEDCNVPVAAARRLADDIAGLELVDLPNAGHFWITRNFPEVLGWLADQGGAGTMQCSRKEIAAGTDGSDAALLGRLGN